MVRFEIKNYNELEEPFKAEVRKIIKNRQDYYENLFKKYDKDLIIEIVFNKEKVYRVSISIHLKSKNILIVEEDRDPVTALNRAFSEFKKAVKRQIALERKDYLYKRKRYRQQKWKEYFVDLTEDVEESVKEDKPKYSRKVKNAMKSVQKYLKKRLKELGFTKKQVKAQLPVIMDLVEKKFYKIFNPKIHGPENLDALLFKITEEILSTYQNTGAESEGDVEIVEFEGDANAPEESVYESEMFFLEDILTDENLIEQVNDAFSPEEIDETIEKLIGEEKQEDQAVYHLYYMEQFDEKEIAGITGQKEEEITKKLEKFKNTVEEKFEKLLENKG